MTMKIGLCFFLLFAASQAERKSFSGDSVYRLKISSPEENDKLTSVVNELELDIWRIFQHADGVADIRVPFIRKSQFNVFLSASKIAYEILIEDVQKLIDEQVIANGPVARSLTDFDYDIYHTYEEIQEWIDLVVATYPDLTTKQELGVTFENRIMSAITLSAGFNRPKFVINCGLHAREWISPATCLLAVKYLVTGYQNNDTEISNLLNNVDFVFIPSSNPDGYAYSHRSDRLWRKTRSVIDGESCVGVDANRNFDSDFGGSGSSSSPCSNVYCGPSAFSEPCTAAQRDFVKNMSNVQMYVDIHSYGQQWMYPYGYTGTAVSNIEILNGIAQDCASAIKAVHNEFYEVGSFYGILYQGSGVTSDYFYDAVGIPCTFTAELRDNGYYGFLLPADQIRPTAEETFAAFKVLAQAVIDGKCISK